MLKLSYNHQFWFKALLIILLTLGIFFHFFNLDKKVYWHDEVYTSMRAAGYTRMELDEGLFKDRLVSVSELQKAQQTKPGSTAQDTIASLAIEDPQHPPLYFLMARFWMQLFGSSLTASRLLPVLISLLSLPAIYFLALELFSSKLTAILATILLSLSPFDILFAQTARQYSLLTLTVIVSSLYLIKALKKSNWKDWLFYSLACGIGFYTHPFFVLTIIAHGVLVIGHWLLIKKISKNLLAFIVAIALTSLLYSPWIYVLATNYQRALATTDWARYRVGILYLIKLWSLSFTSLFVDLDFGFDNIWNYILRAFFIVIIIASIYRVCHQGDRLTRLFILTSILVPFLLLALPDLISGGKRSAVTRYLIPCFPAIQLAVAYFLAQTLAQGKQIWRGIFAVAITITIISCTVNGFADTAWSKDLSYHNGEVTRVINASSSPLIISDRGDDWTNLGDLISLSYWLNQDVKLLLLTYPPNLEKIQAVLAQNNSDVFIFRPSQKLFSGLEASGEQLEIALQYGRLWKLKPKS
jgi:uncharacterized membrane protein